MCSSDLPDAEYRDALRRIQRAAEQMGRRVDDLLLLARAEAGERPPVQDVVELDGLVLECADLMRRRAETLGRALELDRVEPAQVTGHDGLLREGLLELLENALRHGGGERPVRISAYVAAGQACIAVASDGPAFAPPGDGADASRAGLGISILQWIADVHRGALRVDRRDGVNVVRLEWPTRGPA